MLVKYVTNSSERLNRFDALSVDACKTIFTSTNVLSEVGDDVESDLIVHKIDNIRVPGLVIYTQNDDTIVVPMDYDEARDCVDDAYDNGKISITEWSAYVNPDLEDCKMIVSQLR